MIMPSAFDSLFENAVQPSMDELFGVSVVLSRGRSDSEAFTATHSTRDFRVVADDGTSTVVTMRSWAIPKASAKIGGVSVTPRRGDRIKDVSSGEEWEITPPEAKRPAVELDEGGYQWLCHTKRVTKET